MAGSRAQDIARVVAKTGALKFGVFELSSGEISPYYLDLRVIPGDPAAFELAVEILREMSGQVGGFERIGGVPTAGVPYAAALAYTTRKPFLYVRKEAKPHGLEKMVEGMLFPGDRVLLVDDLVTTGTSLLKAAQAVRGEGGVVEHALVVVDREEGGDEALRRSGVELHSAVRLLDLLKVLREIEAVAEEEYASISDWVASRRGPG